VALENKPRQGRRLAAFQFVFSQPFSLLDRFSGAFPFRTFTLLGFYFGWHDVKLRSADLLKRGTIQQLSNRKEAKKRSAILQQL